MEDNEIIIGIKTNNKIKNKKINSLFYNGVNANNKNENNNNYSNTKSNSKNHKKASLNSNTIGKNGVNKKTKQTLNNNEKQLLNNNDKNNKLKVNQKNSNNKQNSKKGVDKSLNLNNKSKKIKNKNETTNKYTNSNKHRTFKNLNSKTRISLAIKKHKSDEEKHKMKIEIVLATLITIVFLIILFSSNIFSIKTIIVNDNSILSDDTIISISGIKKYTNIFGFRKISAINNIKSSAYIEMAKVKRSFPSTVEITVKERIPTFMLQVADSYVYINNQGYILEISNERLNIPILAGTTTDLINIKPGNRINEDDLKKMNTVIKIFEIAKSNDLSDLITKIDISDIKNYIIILENEGKKVYLGDCSDSDLNTKMLYLKSIIDASQGRVGEVFLNVDLNSQKVYVRWSTE